MMISTAISAGGTCPAGCPGEVTAVAAAIVILVPLLLRALKERRKRL